MIAIRTLLAATTVFACLTPMAWAEADCTSRHPEATGRKARICIKGKCEVTELAKICGDEEGKSFIFRNDVEFSMPLPRGDKPASTMIYRFFDVKDFTCKDLDDGNVCPEFIKP